MADLSKMQVGTTVYNMKDATARNSLTPATQTKNGLMSAADKKKLDNTPDIVVIDLSLTEGDSSDSYNFINNRKAEINEAVVAGKVIYIEWRGIDGPSLHPVTYAYDSMEFYLILWGDPLMYDGDGKSVIAVEYKCSGDLNADGFDSYRLVTATKPDFINL